MALVSRWDIRDESYSNGDSVTLLTDRAGTTNLTSNCGAVFQTNESTNDAMVFAADACAIGSASLAAALAAVPQGAAWSMFFLVRQSSFDANMFGGFGNGSSNAQGVLIRDDATGAITSFVRDSSSVNNVATASTTRSAGTWYVLGMVYNGTNIVVTINGANAGTVAKTADLSGDTWNQFAIGAFFRDNIALHANGLYREVRVYNSNETANLSTIVSSMQAGGGPPSGATGTLAATETGADVFAGAGTVGNNGIRLTLRDTDTGALAANLTNVIVSVRSTTRGTELAGSSAETTSAGGVLEFASGLIGAPGATVRVFVEKSDGTVIGAYIVQVVDLNA
jgi:hypothetical protein